MRNYFMEAKRRFQNYLNLMITHKRITEFLPIMDIRQNIFKLFNLLRDSEDDHSGVIKICAWRLLATIELSILPFDHRALLLTEQLETISKEVVHFPMLGDFYRKISETIEWLEENPSNPKREFLFQKLQDWPDGKRVGLVSRLVRGSMVPGWGDDVTGELVSLRRNISLLKSVSDFREKIFDYIVLPSAGGSCPFMSQILSMCSAREILLISYGRERKYKYYPGKLPAGTFSMKGGDDSSFSLSNTDHDETWSVDDWVDDTYWQRVRDSAMRNEALNYSSDNLEVLVTARLILLGESKMTFFGEQYKVIEISGLMERLSGKHDSVKKFPRKPAKQLKPGDLVVMRTIGGGDMLDEVSERLMQQDGRVGLYDSAIEWKEKLKRGLFHHSGGVELIAAKLRDRGHNIRESQYIKVWATNLVIKPETYDLFEDLICILYGLGYIPSVTQPKEYAKDKWIEMKELIRYRMKAGRNIRNSLLDRLKEVIESGEEIGDEYRLSLKGVGGGELTVFRISGVDNQQIEVPYTRIATVLDVVDE